MLPIPSDTTLNDRYRILDILGKSSSGYTYLASDLTRMDAKCAIEELGEIANETEATDGGRELFAAAAGSLYQLQHPQLPRFWATFEEQNRVFLVRDYIPGFSYAEILDRARADGGKFKEENVRQFLFQILPVLDYIHSKGIVHQHLSPETIILRQEDNLDPLPVPIDFGEVRQIAAHWHSTDLRSGWNEQAAYLAPELKQGRSAKPCSDLYSLGIITLVMLTGKDADALADDRGVVNWDWRKDTPVSNELVRILTGCLEVKESNRYQSADEVFEDLQAISLSVDRDREPIERVPTANFNDNYSSSTTVPKHRVNSAITNFKTSSIWEKPSIFIPLGILVSLTAGFGSWFGISQFLHRKPAAPVVEQPAPQTEIVTTPADRKSDFNNPTIAKGESGIGDTGVTIQPIVGQNVTQTGTVDGGATVSYKLAAAPGQTYDINTGSSQVLMSILDRVGTPVDSKAERVSSWRGDFPVAGEYTIQMRPIQGLDGKAFPFSISVAQSTSVASPDIPAPGGFSSTPSEGSTGTNNPTSPDRSNPNPNAPNPIYSAPTSVEPPVGGNAIPLPIVPSSGVIPPTQSGSSTIPNFDRPKTDIPKTTSEEKPRRRRRVQTEDRSTPNVSRNNEERPRRRRRIQTEDSPTPSVSRNNEERPRRRRVRSTETAPANINPEGTNSAPEYRTPIAVPKPKTETVTPPASSGGDGDGDGLDTTEN
jgi:serine/threonine protein kinase